MFDSDSDSSDNEESYNELVNYLTFFFFVNIILIKLFFIV